jgi:cystathionine beta-lyase
MIYNFYEIWERTATDSMKWSKSYLKGNFGDEELLPMWIADMDFKVPQPIIDAILQRASHGIFGYGMVDDQFLQVVVNWQKRRNNWKIEKDWILFTPGIIPALNFITQCFCLLGDKVVIQSPVYYPFKNIIESNGCHVANNPLIYKEGRYTMDFSHLEEIVQDTRVKMLILCSPHNPVGRVWTYEELKRLGEICIRNGVLIVSDEIHGDLIFKGNKHIPFGSISEEFAMNSIICTAPTKTFNLAGIQCSNIIIKNKRLRDDLTNKLLSIDITPNSFAYVAQIAAYSEGEEWLEQLLSYLEGNVRFIEDFVKEKLPGVTFVKPEATYLAWLDFSKLTQNHSELEELMRKKAGLALDEGYIFGKGGEGFERINFACPREILERALINIEKAVSVYKNYISI